MSLGLGSNRWHVIAESRFPWEREALDWLRSQLPDQHPWHVWTNFEFIDDEGKINEIDALALTPAGLFLIEIKSRPGIVSGDTHTWSWRTDGREYTVDNPLLLTDRKAKRLASLLRRQPAIVKAKIRLPFVQPLVFLSATKMDCQLRGPARTGVYLRGQPSAINDEGIVEVLTRGTRPLHTPLDAHDARAISKGFYETGIRPSNKHRQVGDYQLGRLIVDGASYQEWEAKHVSVDVQRRVRIYNLASATSPEERKTRIHQAQREFKILEGIEHAGILRCRDYKETELGPALIFDHDPKAVRLDHLMRDQGARLSAGQRLELVREIAHVLQYAHRKRLYHRALGPQSILVRGMEGGDLRVQLMNWQTAARQDDTASSAGTVHRTTGTQHVEAYVEDPGLVYLAPETARADPAHGAELDVFSLGCLTYLVFSGQPPASSTLEMTAQLRQGPGLRLSDVLDGCSQRLHELVQIATNPDVLGRFETIKDFLDELFRVEDELTAPEPEQYADPSRAVPKDRLEGGFTVVKRMGRGSSSDALLVQKDGSDDELVLKVAVDASHSDNLQAESEALKKLHPHQNIVEWRDTVTVSGRTALLLRSAGNETLAHKLKHEGRLSLDMLQRFGEELIDAARHLEDNAVIHRDIKPENIGITKSRTGKLKLVLFDFSLTRTAPENLTAGTPPYLDPFLQLRSHRRWDLYAERFAVAVTLYEMAIGRLPFWGDGQTAPAMLDVEATIEIDAFDPVVREPLTQFFNKALRRDFRERHDNAEEMLRAWRAAFERASTAHPSADGFEAIAQIATTQTTMAELGYSIEAQDVLERMGVHNARELLAVDRIKFRYLRGVGDKIRKEIRLKAKDLARLRPDLTQGRGSLHDMVEGQAEDAKVPITVNELAESLLPRRPAGDDRPEEGALAYYLGIDDAVSAGEWPTLGSVADATGVARGTLTTALVKARERWLKNKSFTELRNQFAVLLAGQGQVMTSHELAQALLALRGCAIQDDTERLRQASAVVRAVLEAESHLDKPRFEVFDHDAVPLVATSSAWAGYARQLGAVADTCALADPLMPPGRVMEALEAVRPTAAAGEAEGPIVSPTPSARILRLATTASRKAALSSRQEIYPRGMPALQALKASLNALLGARECRVRDLQDRVRGRYPEAEPLPERPLLDRLLEEAGAPLQWEPSAAEGAGAYRRSSSVGAETSGTTTRYVTLRGSSRPPLPAAVADAQALQARLQRALQQGGLLVLTVEPRVARRAETELRRRFSTSALQVLNVDALLLRELRVHADALRVPWATLLRADAADSGSRDWRNLQSLVQRAVPALRKALLESTQPLLVVNAGLLARYELLSLVTELEIAAGRPGHTPAAWLLLPTSQPALAVIDGTPVPLVQPFVVTALAQPWVDGVDLASGSSAA